MLARAARAVRGRDTNFALALALLVVADSVLWGTVGLRDTVVATSAPEDACLVDAYPVVECPED